MKERSSTTTSSEDRKIWIRSFQRSGNTFYRIVLYHGYGFPSWSKYGFECHDKIVRGKKVIEEDIEAMFIKTHTVKWANDDNVVIVRDPRDVILSRASYHRMLNREYFEKWFDEKIINHWLSFFNLKGYFIKYEDMLKDPAKWVGESLDYFDIEHGEAGPIPTFEELKAVRKEFYRKGIAGSYKDDDRMSKEIHDMIMEKCGFYKDFESGPSSQ